MGEGLLRELRAVEHEQAAAEHGRRGAGASDDQHRAHAVPDQAVGDASEGDPRQALCGCGSQSPPGLAAPPPHSRGARFRPARTAARCALARLTRRATPFAEGPPGPPRRRPRDSSARMPLQRHPRQRRSGTRCAAPRRGRGSARRPAPGPPARQWPAPSRSRPSHPWGEESSAWLDSISQSATLGLDEPITLSCGAEPFDGHGVIGDSHVRAVGVEQDTCSSRWATRRW